MASVRIIAPPIVAAGLAATAALTARAAFAQRAEPISGARVRALAREAAAAGKTVTATPSTGDAFSLVLDETQLRTLK